MLITSDLGLQKKYQKKFLNIGRFVCANSSRFGPPPAISSRVGTPGCGEYPLSGSDGYHNECGYPTAEHSERHTSQLAPQTSPVQDAGQANSTRDTESSAQLSKGCNPAPYQGCITSLLSSGECITPPLRTAIRVNNATTHCIKTSNGLMIGMRMEGAYR